VWVGKNGGSYNYLELREQAGRGRAMLYEQSDTEVLAHGYEEWANRCGALNGICVCGASRRRAKLFPGARSHGHQPCTTRSMAARFCLRRTESADRDPTCAGASTRWA